MSGESSEAWFLRAVEHYEAADKEDILTRSDSQCALGELAMQIAWYLKESGR